MEVRCNKSAKGMKLAPSSSSCFITNLPTPILMDILCRLPFKTLTACKCACKSWLNLSRDPEFTQLHQTKAPTEVFFQLYNDKDTLKLHMGNFHCLNNVDPLDVKLNTLFQIPEPNNTLDYQTVTGDFNFSNSCNGLLCYYGGDRNRFVVVWNPCTSEFITLKRYNVLRNCCGYGLGFSRKANQYKLLRIVSSVTGRLAETCTIEKGCSWKSLGPCPSDVSDALDRYTFRMQGTFLHGTLHWLSDEYDIHILTFDFEDDQFGRVPLPSSFSKNKLNTLRSCQVGELLGCLFITEYTNEGMDIWLMKEYGVEDSWTKMYSLPLPCNATGRRIDEYCVQPVTCMDNGEILLVNNKHVSTIVFSYNPDLEGFRCIGSGHGLLRAIAYRPSFVPLKDSVLGYEVHTSALRHREIPTTPNWWTLLTKCERRKGHVRATSKSSLLPNVSAVMKDAMKRLRTMRMEEMAVMKDAMKRLRTMRMEEMEKKRKEQHAQRMRNEFVKVVEPLEEQIEQLKQHNRQLEERLQNEHAKVKQLEEKLQQSEQLMDEMRARFVGSH